MDTLRLKLGVLVTSLIVGMIACGGGTEIQLGQTVTGLITEFDADDDEWKSKAYVIEVREGITYRFDLSSSTEDTVGVWIQDRFGYIVEVSPVVTSRTGFHTFSESGSQDLFVQSPKSDVPSEFTLTVTAEPQQPLTSGLAHTGLALQPSLLRL